MLSVSTPSLANEQAVNAALRAAYIQTGAQKVVAQSEDYGQILLTNQLKRVGLEREMYLGLGFYKILKSRELTFNNWRLTENAVYVTIHL
jgi:hypothetical protein